MTDKKQILSYRTTMPFDGGLSPTSPKSVIPTNNVTTIQDVLDGKQYKIPGGGGDWSSGWGEDTLTSYREQGDDYKRLERDKEILDRMMVEPMTQEQWKVRVPGGSKVFTSFPLAQKYKEKLKNKGIPCSYVSRIAQVTQNSQRVETIASTINKCFMVESINVQKGVKENGAAFCVAPNYFVTCAHVIRKYNKNNISAEQGFGQGSMLTLVQGGSRFKATFVSADLKLDIALIKSDIKIEPLELDTTFVMGEDVICIGSPLGYENNVSAGTIGSLNRKVYFYDGAPLYTFIDLAIFPGNSGGPVIKESNGKVMGMMTLIVAEEGFYGLNASLPSLQIEGFCKSNIEKFNSK